MYYHTILQKTDEELVKCVFLTQQKFSVKNDWINTLRDDLNQCGILQSESEIKQMKKGKFKKLVKDKIRQLSNEYLVSLQESHSKSRKIRITENIKHYLISNEISLEEKRLLFQVRSRMCDVKTNYKTKYSHNMRCRLCDQQEESELHLMMCDEIIDEQLLNDVNKISLCDVWSTHSRQISAIKVLNKKSKIRNLKYEKRKLSTRTQENPTIVSSSYTACMTLD